MAEKPPEAIEDEGLTFLQKEAKRKATEDLLFQQHREKHPEGEPVTDTLRATPDPHAENLRRGSEISSLQPHLPKEVAPHVLSPMKFVSEEVVALKALGPLLMKAAQKGKLAEFMAEGASDLPVARLARGLTHYGGQLAEYGGQVAERARKAVMGTPGKGGPPPVELKYQPQFDQDAPVMSGNVVNPYGVELAPRPIVPEEELKLSLESGQPAPLPVEGDEGTLVSGLRKTHDYVSSRDMEDPRGFTAKVTVSSGPHELQAFLSKGDDYRETPVDPYGNTIPGMVEILEDLTSPRVGDPERLIKKLIEEYGEDHRVRGYATSDVEAGIYEGLGFEPSLDDVEDIDIERWRKGRGFKGDVVRISDVERRSRDASQASAKGRRAHMARRTEQIVKQMFREKAERDAPTAARRLALRERQGHFDKFSEAETGKMKGKQLPFVDVDAAEIGQPAVYRAFHGSTQASTMTQFKAELSDDGISFFMARQRPIAESYVHGLIPNIPGQVKRRLITALRGEGNLPTPQHGDWKTTSSNAIEFDEDFQAVIREYGLLEPAQQRELRHVPTVIPDLPHNQGKKLMALYKKRNAKMRDAWHSWKRYREDMDPIFQLHVDIERGYGVDPIPGVHTPYQQALKEKAEADLADYRSLQEEIRKKVEEGEQGGILDLYVKMENPYVVDARGNDWSNIKVPVYDDETYRHAAGWDQTRLPGFLAPNADTLEKARFRRMNTRKLARWAQREGYDGVIIKNVRDTADYSDNVGDVLIGFDPLKLKLTENEGIFDRANPYWGLVLPLVAGLEAMRETGKAE